MDDSKHLPLDRRAHKIGHAILLVALFIVLTLAAFAQEFASTHPIVALIGAAIWALVALTLQPDGVGRLVEWATKKWDVWTGRPVLIRVAAAAVVVAVSLTGAFAGPPIWRWADKLLNPSAFCPHTAELHILTSADSLGPTRQLADDYAKWTADHNDDNDYCPTVFPFVYAADSASGVTAALARGWRADDTENPRVTIGPRPDVWLPNSTMDVRRVTALAEGEHNPSHIENVESIASSSMVLGLLGGAAAPLGKSWRDQVEAYVRSGAPLLAPDPEVSTIGLMAAQAYLPPNPPNGSVDLILARQRAQHVLASGSAAGDDSAALLCRYRREVPVTRPKAAAVLTSRQLWQRFVSGEALGTDCPGGAGPRPDITVPLSAPDVPVLDHPFVDFSWTEQARRPAVNAFHAWLLSPAGQERLANMHLDPARTDCSWAAKKENDPCVPMNLDVSLDLYRRVKLPGRVLLALDASGSMNASGTRGRTRFKIASQGVTEALGQVGLRDQVGLWVFPNVSDRGWKVLVGVADGTPQHRRQIVAKLNTEDPTGSTTPLYPTLLSGLRAAAGPATDTHARALVVLTDGEDTTGRRVADVEREVRLIAASTGVRLYIIAIGDATCDAADGSGLRRLTTAGNGRCFSTGPEGMRAIMAELFGLLWSGR